MYARIRIAEIVLERRKLLISLLGRELIVAQPLLELEVLGLQTGIRLSSARRDSSTS
jgi:hypothetical protein